MSVASTPPRRMDFKYTTGLNFGLTDMRQRFNSTAGVHHHVFSDLTRLAARRTSSPVLSVVGQNAGCHGLQKFNLAHPGVATPPLAGSARVLTNLKTLQTHRKAELQHLRICQA
jgi:hypothetical protein